MFNLPHPSETTLFWFRVNNLVLQDRSGRLHWLRLPRTLDGVGESLAQALDYLPEDLGLIFDRKAEFLWDWNILGRDHVARLKSGQPIDEFLNWYAGQLDHRVREFGMASRQDFMGEPFPEPPYASLSERFSVFFGHKPVPSLAEAA